MSLSMMVLVVVSMLIPVVGFIMTIVHARKGDTRMEQRWRKSHGILFWALVPGLAGLVMVMAALELLPRIFSILSVALLGGTTFLSRSIQSRHDDQTR